MISSWEISFFQFLFSAQSIQRTNSSSSKASMVEYFSLKKNFKLYTQIAKELVFPPKYISPKTSISVFKREPTSKI
jgi:hypothetical protein